MIAGLMVLGLMTTGCLGVASPVLGVFVTDSTYGGVPREQGGSKTGEACATSTLTLLAMGDTSVEAAAKEGGITKAKSIRHSSDWTLIFGTYCTIVTGD
jgi:hypothetical protein